MSIATVSPGTTVAEMVGAGLPCLLERERGMVRVTNNGQQSSKRIGLACALKVGTSVVIRVVPAGDVFRSILALVVTVAAIVIGQYYVVPALLEAGFSVGAAAAGLSPAAIPTPRRGGNRRVEQRRRSPSLWPLAAWSRAYFLLLAEDFRVASITTISDARFPPAKRARLISLILANLAPTLP